MLGLVNPKVSDRWSQKREAGRTKGLNLAMQLTWNIKLCVIFHPINTLRILIELQVWPSDCKMHPTPLLKGMQQLSPCNRQESSSGKTENNFLQNVWENLGAESHDSPPDRTFARRIPGISRRILPALRFSDTDSWLVCRYGSVLQVSVFN